MRGAGEEGGVVVYPHSQWADARIRNQVSMFNILILGEI